MSHFGNVGIIGSKKSGRTQLITTLTINLSCNLSFHEMDFPTSIIQMKQMITRRNLSLLLLIVPESFQDRQAAIIEEANKLNLNVAIVITKFDATLMNLDPLTHKFTPDQKLKLIEFERNEINKTLQNYYSCERSIQIFHVSCLCFPKDVKLNFQACYTDEEKLCEFLSNPLNFSLPITNQKNSGSGILNNITKLINSCSSVKPRAQHFDSISLSAICPVNNGNTTSLAIYEPKSLCIPSNMLAYDIAFIGKKDEGSIEFLNRMVYSMFDGIIYTYIEYNDPIDIKKRFEHVESCLAVIVFKDDKIDGTAIEAINQLKNDKTALAVVILAENDKFSSSTKMLENYVPSNLIFVINIALENHEKAAAFYKLIQEKTGKKFKQEMISKKRGISECIFPNILLLGLSETNMAPIFSMLKMEGKVKKIEFSEDPKTEEIISEIKAAEMAVITIHDSLLYSYYPLFEELKNQNLRCFLIWDATKSQQQSQNYSIEPIFPSLPLISQIQCFKLSQSSETINDQFIKAIKNAAINTRGKSGRYDNPKRF